MELYGGEGYPTNAVIDRTGVLRYSQSGFDEEAVVGTIERLLGN